MNMHFGTTSRPRQRMMNEQSCSLFIFGSGCKRGFIFKINGQFVICICKCHVHAADQKWSTQHNREILLSFSFGTLKRTQMDGERGWCPFFKFQEQNSKSNNDKKKHLPIITWPCTLTKYSHYHHESWSASS